MVLQFTDDLNVFSISNWCYENIKMYRIQFSWNKGGCKYCFRVTNECLYAKMFAITQWNTFLKLFIKRIFGRSDNDTSIIFADNIKTNRLKSISQLTKLVNKFSFVL